MTSDISYGAAGIAIIATSILANNMIAATWTGGSNLELAFIRFVIYVSILLGISSIGWGLIKFFKPDIEPKDA
jgi:hypothetical protein